MDAWDTSYLIWMDAWDTNSLIWISPPPRMLSFNFFYWTPTSDKGTPGPSSVGPTLLHAAVHKLVLNSTHHDTQCCNDRLSNAHWKIMGFSMVIQDCCYAKARHNLGDLPIDRSQSQLHIKHPHLCWTQKYVFVLFTKAPWLFHFTEEGIVCMKDLCCSS